MPYRFSALLVLLILLQDAVFQAAVRPVSQIEESIDEQKEAGTGPCSEKAATRNTAQLQKRWRFITPPGDTAVQQIRVYEKFKLSSSPTCQDYISEVDVAVRIDPIDPVNHSVAIYTIDPSKHGRDYYVCFIRKNPPCNPLSKLHVDSQHFRVKRFVELTEGFLPSRVRETAYVENVEHDDLLTLLEWAVVVLFVACLIAIGCTYFVFKSVPLEERHQIDHSFVLKTQSSLFATREACLQSLMYVSSTGALITLLLFTLFKHSDRKSVVLIVILWPATFGTVGLFKLWHSYLRLQIFNVALVNGVCLRTHSESFAARHASHIIIVIGLAILFLCLLASGVDEFSWCDLLRMGISVIAWPLLGMLKPLKIAFEVDELLRKMHYVMALENLAEILGVEEAPTKQELEEQDHSDAFMERLRTSSMSFVPEGSFCEACRTGQDPLVQSSNLSGAGFELRDIRWHGSVVLKMSGSVFAIPSPPLVLLFWLLLTLVSLQGGSQYLGVQPALQTIELNPGILEKDFEPQRTEYTLVVDANTPSIGMFTRANPDSTQMIKFDFPIKVAGKQNYTKNSSSYDTVRLSSAPFPRIASVTVHGLLDRSTEYRVFIADLQTLVTALRIRDTNTGFSRCVGWPSVRSGMRISIPTNTTDLQFELALARFVPKVPVSDTRRSKWQGRYLQSVYAAKEQGSYATCKLHCRLDPRCLSHDFGVKGCFLVYFASKACRPMNYNSADPYRPFVHHLPEGEFCMLGQKSGCEKLALGNSTRWMTTDIKPSWTSNYFEGEFRMKLSSDEDGSKYKEKIRLAQGTPLPDLAFVHLEGENTPSVSVKLRDEVMDVTLGWYYDWPMREPLKLYLAPVLHDYDFAVEWQEAELATNWKKDNVTFKQCSEVSKNLGFYRGYAPCTEGGHSVSVAKFELDPWRPQRIELARVKPGLEHFGLADFQVRVHTQDDVEPAQWFMLKNCGIFGNSMAKSVALDLVTPAVIETAVDKCFNKTIWIATDNHNSTFSITEFVAWGIERRFATSRHVAQFLTPIQTVDKMKRMLAYLNFSRDDQGACLRIKNIRIPVRLIDIITSERDCKSNAREYLIARTCEMIPNDETSLNQALVAAVQASCFDTVHAVLTCVKNKGVRIKNSENRYLTAESPAWHAISAKRSDLLEEVLQVYEAVDMVVSSDRFRAHLPEWAAIYDCMTCISTLRKMGLHLTRFVIDGYVMSADEITAMTPSLTIMERSLRTLRIENSEFGTAGAEVLQPFLQELTNIIELGLGGNRIRDDGLHAIAKSLQKLDTLRHLGLGSNELSAGAVAQLLGRSNRSFPVLEHLDLSFNKIGDHEADFSADKLGESLTSRTSLKVVNLTQNEIQDASIVLAFAVLPNLAILDLSNNFQSSDPQKHLIVAKFPRTKLIFS